MRRQLIIAFFFTLSLAQFAGAQERGSVVVIKDPQIDSLISRRLALRQVGSTGNVVTSLGFRVQIFSGLGREKAFEEQTRFKSLFPGVSSYVSYTQPNYRIRVGDFRTKLEAQKFVNELNTQYPTLFIFPEKINPK